jgi:ABC-type microcin C transport system duplicated ATPase subunit YejF
MIFQDPFSSLDPKKTINQIISEPIRVNKFLRISINESAFWS